MMLSLGESSLSAPSEMQEYIELWAGVGGKSIDLIYSGNVISGKCAENWWCWLSQWIRRHEEDGGCPTFDWECTKVIWRTVSHPQCGRKIQLPIRSVSVYGRWRRHHLALCHRQRNVLDWLVSLRTSKCWTTVHIVYDCWLCWLGLMGLKIHNIWGSTVYLPLHYRNTSVELPAVCVCYFIWKTISSTTVH